MSSATVTDPSKRKISPFAIAIAVVIAISLAVFGTIAYNATRDNTDGGNLSGWNFANGENIENISVSYNKDNEYGTSIDFSIEDKKKDDPHNLDIYEDPQCPACRQLQESFHGEISQAIKNGDVLRVHPMTFLDTKIQGSTLSHEIVTALIVLAQNNEADAAWNIYENMWFNESSQGKKTSVENVMKDAGASDDAVQAYKDQTNGYGLAADSNASNADFLEKKIGSVGTPTVMVDGENYEVPNDWLEVLGL